jgi:hypothetical protein
MEGMEGDLRQKIQGLSIFTISKFVRLVCVSRKKKCQSCYRVNRRNATGSLREASLRATRPTGLHFFFEETLWGSERAPSAQVMRLCSF